MRRLSSSALIVLLLVASFAPSAPLQPVRASPTNMELRLDSVSDLPDFRLPYSEDAGVYWTGGPHAYGLADQTSTFDTGEGSGLDFASGSNPNFEVLAMADGEVIDVSRGNPGFGYQVAIQHDVGDAVLIYAHLLEGSITVSKTNPPTHVSQGTILGKAGKSGGQKDVHLHIELRYGTKVNGQWLCYRRCLPGNLGGNPWGWEDGLPLVDGYNIFGYLADGEGLRTYNYDGSAVKGTLVVRNDFPYRDQPGNIQRSAIARIHSSFQCSSNEDCEINNLGSPTQFAGHGTFGPAQGAGLSLEAVAVSQLGGHLISTNVPRQPPLPPHQTFDYATFVRDVTIPDGTPLSANQAFIKTWAMRNSGTSTWGSGYQLCFTGGHTLGAPDCVPVSATAPNATVEISVNMKAPGSGGTYRGNWRIKSPNGTWFGDPVWVIISVPGGSGGDPPPPPSTGSDIELSCQNCSSVVLSPGETFRPTIHATLHSGQLLESHGDMLRNVDGNLFGIKVPHIGVVGTVNAPQSYDFTFYADNPIHAPNADGTYETKWRIWRNNAWAGPEIAIRFDVRQGGSNRRPNTPTTRSPSDWYVAWNGGQVTLCASHNGDPDGDAIVGYEFNVQGANNWNSGDVGSDCATTSGLGFYTFGWRVRVKDSRGAWSDWSDPEWRFTIHNAAAIQGPDFSPASPSAAQTVNVWACSNGGTMKYWVNLANDGSGSGQWWQFYEGPICSDPDHNNPSIWPGWQTFNYTDGPHLVRVENGLGGTVEGVYTLQPRRPAWPEPLNPPDQSFQNSRTNTFNWGHGMFGDYPTRATSYTLRVSLNPDPNQNPMLNVTVGSDTATYTHTFNDDYPTLYWQVTATNGQGSTTSNVFRFGIDRVAPIASVNALPAVSTDSAMSVGWGGTDNTAGIRWYDLQYRDGERGEWLDWQQAVSTTVDIFIGQPGHTYHFRAQAMDNAGNWQTYASGGDTQTKIDLSAKPPTPWWNAAYASKRDILIQNNDSDIMPVGYPVWLHFDANTTPSSTELYNTSLSANKGDDVRITYQNQTQLNRYIRTFRSDRIDIWFQTQTSIAGLGYNNTDYQVYFGNASPDAPPGSAADVLPPGNDGNTMGIWLFNEESGSAFADASGRGHSGTLQGPFAWGEDAFGPYIEWPGGGDGTAWGEVGSSSDFDLSQLTMEAWVYPIYGGTPEMTILIRPASTENCPGYRLAVSDRKVDFQTCPGPRAIDGQLSFDTWSHIAATFDGSDMRIYHNGRLLRTVIGQPLRSTAGRLLYLGGAPWNQTFKGYVRYVRLSNIARTDFSYAQSLALITQAPEAAVGAPILPPGSGSPDLAVLSLASYPNPNGGTLLQAVIQNQGTATTLNGFFTDVYANHLPTGTGDYTGSIQFWVNDPIAAGATVTLTTVITEVTTLGLMSPASMEALSESSATLYAQVDSTGAVTEGNNNNNISTGTQVCLASADTYESDDSVQEAKTINVGQTQTHNMDSPGDQDWMKFVAQAGETYTIRTANLGTSADTYLYLYDTDRTTLLASNDDYGGSLASQIEWAAPATGTYYVAVQHWNPNAGGCGTTYDLMVSPAATTAVLSLSTDWNLLSIPLSPSSTAITDVLSSIAGSYDLVYTYDAPDTTDPWKKYNTAAPPFLNDLTNIDETVGFWIRASDAVTLTVLGTTPVSPTIPLVTGWNLVGYPSQVTRPITEAFSSCAGEYDLVYAYDALDTTDPWKKYNVAAPPFLNDLTEMGSGLGYWVRMTEACMWKPDGG